MENQDVSTNKLLLKSGIGGVFMGLANLVPGISGGTMLLAAGIYPDFVNSVAETCKLKLKRRNIMVLGGVAGAAALAILLFAGPIKDLVVHQRWMMYSLFIGLTLGGIPVVKQLAGQKPSRQFWTFSVIGFTLMALIALAQSSGAGEPNGMESGMLLMFLAGLAGASAMILPGLSGGYLLLILGAYVPILSGIDALKNALKAQDIDMLLDPLIHVVVPVGLGVVIGVAVVSNVLKWALDTHKSPTLGILLGLLVGAVVGLWPFQEPVEPAVGMIVKGTALTMETLNAVDAEDLPTQFFNPSLSQCALSIGLIAIGVIVTWGIAKLGAPSKVKPNHKSTDASQ